MTFQSQISPEFVQVLNRLTAAIIGAAIEVHRYLGPGLLESTYEVALAYELERLNLRVERQLKLPILYKELRVEDAYRIDLLVENKVLVELKAVENLLPVHEAQVLTYLKHSKLSLGLLFNFNVKILKEGGIQRIKNG